MLAFSGGLSLNFPGTIKQKKGLSMSHIYTNLSVVNKVKWVHALIGLLKGLPEAVS